SSLTSAPHSGTVANTLNAACAGTTTARSAAAMNHLIDEYISFSPSELVRTVRSESQDVLKEELVVGEIGPRLALCVLNTESAEFRRRPVEHHRRSLRGERVGGKKGGVGAVIGRALVQLVIAQPDPPHRHELPDAL